ncbi:helix-turn-helix domain-containing protein [Xanthomonas vasicola]|uniref:hypothetical protein n=1 Tax=Xanthomonas vasicola TaxID=56459 RepID=UPI00036A5FB0|nr:hypothetical protein [Xanthomonas vasicola]MDO6954017.1 DNA-binding protein [Xanthomonas vasicola]
MSRKAQAQQQSHLRTTAQAREWLVSNGITVSEFARQLGVNRTVVDDLLRGRSQGKYGDAHTAAIALGLKSPPNYAAKVQTSKRSRGEHVRSKKNCLPLRGVQCTTHQTHERPRAQVSTA